jgi:hypothetical protein
MIITVTNTSGRTINTPALGEDGVALPGGNHPEEASHRTDPLPYPFAHVGAILDTNTSVLPMHPRDWRYSRSQMARGLPVSEKWNQLVQADIVTFATGAQVNFRDVEEDYVATV